MNTPYLVGRLCLFLCSVGIVHTDAVACTPSVVGYEDVSLSSVLSRFEKVDTVVIATLVKMRRVLRKERGSEALSPVEIATFRVDRRFKGSAKKGSYFTLTTILQGCMEGANDDPIDGMPPNQKMLQWLIYRNVNDTTQISRSSYYTQPLTWGHADIEFLELIVSRAKTAKAGTPQL
ncbi:MAG: hypothetical protein V4857_16640 [Pseudomonadota bacterium]